MADESMNTLGEALKSRHSPSVLIDFLAIDIVAISTLM
jgi:hypothetical protein